MVKAVARPDGDVCFGPFRLDVTAGCVWRGGEMITLRPKVWQVLCVLVANPGRLLTKDDLIELVWEGDVVGDTLPNVSVTELRRALGDSAKKPLYIQTVHGRGFRFIATIQNVAALGQSAAPAAALGQSAAPVAAPGKSVAHDSGATAASTAAAPSAVLVGREPELELLAGVLRADAECRVGFISGEAGIGKTSLLNALLRRGVSARAVVGRGQCLAHFGQSYPYLALLGALEDMCRTYPQVLPLMHAVAPMWLRRLPGHSSDEESETPRPGAENVSAAAIDELLALQKALGEVVWALEDLHWADHASVELLSVLIERAPRSSCGLVATYRLAEAIATSHPLVRLRRELRRRQRCREVVLEGLNGAGVAEYVALRRPGIAVPDWLPHRLLMRTGGHPFFLVSTVDHLIDAGELNAGHGDGPRDWQRLAALLDEVPPTLRDALHEQVSDTNPAERALLEAASVGGLEVDAATIAAALAQPVVAVDAACTALTRHSLMLQRVGESVWPDGTASGRYQFRHALYQEVLYEDQSPAARRQMHGRIASALATAFHGDSVAAPIIADHFERGGNNDAAITYHVASAQMSNQRFASQQAAWHLRRALSLLPRTVAADDDRSAMILAELGQVLPALQGFGDPGLREIYLHARRSRGSGPQTSDDYAVMAGLLLASLMQRQAAAAEELGRELLEMAVDPRSRAYADQLMGAVYYHQGNLRGTIEHADRAIALAPSGLTLGPLDHRCAALAMSGAAVWQVGRPDEAALRGRRALEIARAEVHPFNLLITLQAVIAIHHWRGERAEVLAMSRELGRCIEEQGVAQAEACAHLLEAWALLDGGDPDAAQRGVERGLAALRQHGTMMQSAYLLCVASEVLIGCGRVAETGVLLEEAMQLIEVGEARWWEPEVHRWQAVRSLGAGDHVQAEEYFARSLDIASQQESHSLRLRTAIDLARLSLSDGQRDAASRLLADARSHIVGGADTRDLRVADEVVAALLSG